MTTNHNSMNNHTYQVEGLSIEEARPYQVTDAYLNEPAWVREILDAPSSLGLMTAETWTLLMREWGCTTRLEASKRYWSILWVVPIDEVLGEMQKKGWKTLGTLAASSGMCVICQKQTVA